MSETAAFCPACGAPCPPEPEKQQDRKKPSIFKIIIPVAVVVLALVALPIIFPGIIPTGAPKESDDSSNTAINDNSAADNESYEAVNSESSETVETVSVSYEDLQANLQEAYTAVEAAWAQESSINTGTDEGNLEQKAANYSELLQTLSNLQAQVVDLAAYDDKLQSAVLSYYRMAAIAAKVRFDYNRFGLGFVYNDKYLRNRPDLFDDGKTAQENYDNMKSWYESAKAEYANFEYPSFVEAYWKEYENILDLNQTVMKKYAMAYNLNDPLRLFSCWELYERCSTVEDNWYQDTLDISRRILFDYGNQSYTYADNLYAEMQDYIDMPEKEKEAYVFKNSDADTLFYRVTWVDTIYPSLYNAYDSLAVVNLATYGGRRDIDIEIEIPGFTQKYRESYKVTDTIKQLFIKPPLLTGELDLSSAKAAQINITLYERNGTQIATYSKPVTIKSKNDVEWSSSEYGVFTQDNILCFLTPESSGIASLKRSAVDEITTMTGGAMDSFPGYQDVLNNHYAVTYLQAAGLMRAMYNSGVRYSMDVFSVSGSNQHVLLPDQVLEQQSGLCIETSLVIASALQSADMHAFLIFPPGHAQVAVEVWNSDEGAGEYFLIETTALSEDIINGSAFEEYAIALLQEELDAENSSCIQYYNSAQWNSYLQDVEYVIDCNDSRILGMTPFSN